jgi:hypothetical protein
MRYHIDKWRLSVTKQNDDDFFGTPSIPKPHFGSGQVAEILKVELWKLNRFLSRYELTSSGQLGEGRGSRRVYANEDIYRIATAMFLINDGFTPKVVTEIMQGLEDADFYGEHDQEGEFYQFGISLRRTQAGPEVHFFREGHTPQLGPDSKTYYAIELSTITRMVDRSIAAYKP